jgi:hypothetical protein
MASATAVMNVLMEVSYLFFLASLIKKKEDGKKNLIYFQGYCSNVTSKCVCLAGYGGLMCELDINECSGNDQICGSFNCINLPGDYKCDCDFFHSGKSCQKSKIKFLIKSNIYLSFI